MFISLLPFWLPSLSFLREQSWRLIKTCTLTTAPLKRLRECIPLMTMTMLLHQALVRLSTSSLTPILHACTHTSSVGTSLGEIGRIHSDLELALWRWSARVQIRALCHLCYEILEMYLTWLSLSFLIYNMEGNNSPYHIASLWGLTGLTYL